MPSETQNVIPDLERHRPETPEEKLAIYALLHKIPPQPPCDACPWRKYPDRVQGCDNAGCGYMHLYMAEKYYQRAMGYWPYADQALNTIKMLLTNSMDLLNNIHKPNEEEETSNGD